MGFKRVFCPLDFSVESLVAFRTAVEMTRQSGGEIFLFHVIESQPVVSKWFPISGMSEVMVELEEKAQQAMESLLSSSASSLEGISINTDITNGRAFVEILNQAKAWGADLIVIGAKGATSLDQVIFGSTAERVAKGSHCSVLVVREGRSET